MTNQPRSAPRRQVARRVVRVFTPALALFVTIVMGSLSAASADAPDSWENDPPVSALHVLLVLVLIPLGLFVLITLLVYIPSMSKAESYQPGQAWRGEPTWFGGPRGGLEAVEKGSPTQIGSGEAESDRGGASGRW